MSASISSLLTCFLPELGLDFVGPKGLEDVVGEGAGGIALEPNLPILAKGEPNISKIEPNFGRLGIESKMEGH
jgi:hypothetical protein